MSLLTIGQSRLVVQPGSRNPAANVFLALGVHSDARARRAEANPMPAVEKFNRNGPKLLLRQNDQPILCTTKRVRGSYGALCAFLRKI